MAPQRISDDPQAPFGYDEDGTVVSPYGLKADGTPRLSNRGRTAGAGFGGGAKKKTAPAPPKKARPTTAEQPTIKANGQPNFVVAATGALELLSLAPSLGAPLLERFIGKRQALALRGDGAILGMMAEPLGQAIGTIAPGVPWLASLLKGGSIPKEFAVLGVTLAKMTSLIIENHRNPNEQLADLSQSMVTLRAQQIAQQIKDMQEEAERVAAGEDQEQPAATEEQAPADLETQRLEDWYRRHEGAAQQGAPSVQIPGQMSVHDLTEPPYREAS